MYLLYVDESGDPGQNGSDYLLLGAAALFEGKWPHVNNDIQALIRKYFPNAPHPDEIHLADLKQGRNVFASLSSADRTNMIADFCSTVSNLLTNEISLFTVIADKRWWFARNAGKTGDDLYAELFESLTSRFDLLLRRRFAEGSPNRGVIVADPHKQTLSQAIKQNHRVFQQHGHRWGSVRNIIETVFFLSSDESPGLQIADLCSYATWRLVNSDDDSIVSQISYAFDREPLTSRMKPGNWHGVTYLGDDSVLRTRINSVWPGAV